MTAIELAKEDLATILRMEGLSDEAVRRVSSGIALYCAAIVRSERERAQKNQAAAVKVEVTQALERMRKAAQAIQESGASIHFMEELTRKTTYGGRR